MRGTVLLVNPNRMKPVVTPVALDYLAQALENAGFGTEVLDLAFAEEPETEIDRALSGKNHLLVAVTARNIDDSYLASQDFCLSRTKEIIDQLKARTDAPLVVGGAGFSSLPRAALTFCQVEFGLQGEGEWSLPLLAGKLAAGEDFGDIPGLLLKKGKGVRQNPVRYGPLKGLSLARREALDHDRYLREGGMVGFETKRGCDRRCAYCADPLAKGRLIRFRHPGDVADELARLYEKGVDHFHTCDSEFNLPEEQAIEVCREIVRRKLGEKIRWYAYASPTPFSAELAGWMRRAGCVGIDFGVDHGSDPILRRLGRDHDAAAVKETARLAREAGFSFMFDLLLGGPGETRETVRQAIELMKEGSPDRVGISLGVRLYPGTALTRTIAREEGLGAENKNLCGWIRGNGTMLRPIFYLSTSLGDEAEEFVAERIAGDSRFLLGSRRQLDRNYNYNANSRLIEAIQGGCRGAFWDILRRMASRTGPDSF